MRLVRCAISPELTRPRTKRLRVPQSLERLAPRLPHCQSVSPFDSRPALFLGGGRPNYSSSRSQRPALGQTESQRPGILAGPIPRGGACAIASALRHRLNFGLDEVDFVGVETVLLVELLVDLSDRLRPVDVRIAGEVLQRDVLPRVARVVLGHF